VPVACAVAIGVAGPLMGNYASDFIVKIMILSIFALSLELLVGMTGLVSLGHAAFYGIGAYVTVLASGSEGGNFALLLPLAMGAAALYALFVGALSLRTRGVYFIMVTLAFAQMAFFVFHDTKVGGGSDGIYMYVRPPWARSTWRTAWCCSTWCWRRWCSPTGCWRSCGARASARRWRAFA
jgi:branched-chain amino acid transport system permease protein